MSLESGVIEETIFRILRLGLGRVNGDFLDTQVARMVHHQTVEGIRLHMSSFKSPKKRTRLHDLELSLRNLRNSGELFIFLLMNLSKKKVNRDFFFKRRLVPLLLGFMQNPLNFRLKFFSRVFDVLLNLSNFPELYQVVRLPDFLGLVALANSNQVFKERALLAQFSMSLFLGFLLHSPALGQKDVLRILEDTYKFVRYSECSKSSVNKKGRAFKFSDTSGAD